MTEKATAVHGKTGTKPVKVAFFPMHPVDDRASGTFCALPAARSADRGVVGTVFQPSSPRLYEFFYRRKTKGWQLRAAIYWYLIVLPRRFFQILRARRYDVISCSARCSALALAPGDRVVRRQGHRPADRLSPR